MIDPKLKPCKGTGKAKGYGCGKITKYRVYGLGKMCCYANWLLTSEEGEKKLKKATLKVIKPRKELERFKLEKKNREKLTTLLNNVKTVCHKYIRIRDEINKIARFEKRTNHKWDRENLIEIRDYYKQKIKEFD